MFHVLNGRRETIVFYLSLLLIVVCAYPTLLYPLGRDQAISAYIGKVINEGGVPFKDAWEQKPPLVYYLYSLAFILFGESMQSIRLFDLLYALATIFLLFQFGNILFGKTVGMLSGIFYGILYFFTNDFWTISNTDGFLVLPTAGSFYTTCIAQRNNRNLLFLLSGILIGCVFMIKFPGVLIVLPISLYMYVETLGSKGGTIRRFFYNTFSVMLGFLLVILLFTMYFMVNHALGELLYALFVFNPIYVKGSFEVGRRAYLDLTLLGFCKKNLLVTIPALCALLSIRLKKPCINELLVVGWLLVSLLGVYIQHRFFLYHWLPVLGPLAMLGAYGCSKIFAQPFLSKKNAPLFTTKNLSLLLIAIPLALFTFKPYMRQFIDFYKYTEGNITRFDYYNTYFGRYNVGDFSYLADEEVAHYLQAHTDSNDYIFIWGFGTLVYFLSDRQSASRFIFPNALLSEWHPRYSEWRGELIYNLTTKRPRYIIIMEKDSLSWITGVEGDSLENIKDFPELERIITHEYTFEKTIEHFHLYRIKA